MAKKAILSVTLNDGADTSVTLTGDEAQSVLSQIERYRNGSTADNGIRWKDEEGKTHFMSYKCLCEVVQNPSTFEDLPEKPCKMDYCIPQGPDEQAIPVPTPPEGD